MLKTCQFQTHCKGDIHSSDTVNIILPGQIIGERPYVYKIVFIFKCIHGCWLQQRCSDTSPGGRPGVQHCN